MALSEIRIDPRTWDEADEARRGEWRASIQGILGAGDSASFPEAAVRLDVAVSGQATTLMLFDETGAELGRAVVPKSALTAHVTEYVDIVRQLDRADDEGFTSARLEALDMAKKLAHDDAARTLRRLCRPLGADHDTCRRIWTLLLTLRVDTTRLTGVRGHRPVR
jgi:uncharacterized protein (UPF0262 family)